MLHKCLHLDQFRVFNSFIVYHYWPVDTIQKVTQCPGLLLLIYLMSGYGAPL